MITAVDSSILIDLMVDDPVHGSTSLRALQEARRLGALVVCPVVWAELCAAAVDSGQMQSALATANIQFDPFDRECAEVAGSYWRTYRREGGSRTRLMPDFFVGAHARVRGGGRLLTRDRGFYRRYFADLHIIGAGE